VILKRAVMSTVLKRDLEYQAAICVQVDAPLNHRRAQILVIIKLEKIDLAHIDLLEAQIHRVITHCTDLGSYIHIGKVVEFANAFTP
jgi:hypothetical protein